MLIAYFDESTHGKVHHRKESAFAIGGYLAPEREFEKECRKLLRDFKLEFFHMTDFENLREQFEGRSKQRKTRYADRIASLLERLPLIGILTGVYVDDYEHVLATAENAASVLPPDPYTYCFERCVARSLAMILKIPGPQTMKPYRSCLIEEPKAQAR